MFTSRREYRPRIPFSDWFPKLKEMEVGRVFHTIRFIDKYDYYKELEMNGTEVDIFMSPSKETIARCRIVGIAVLTVYDMDEKIVRADTYPHWTLLDLRKLLTRFYQSKEEWQGKNSRFIMIFLLPIEKTFEMQWEPTYKEEQT